jgi:hypothetical protein
LRCLKNMHIVLQTLNQPEQNPEFALTNISHKL